MSFFRNRAEQIAIATRKWVTNPIMGPIEYTFIVNPDKHSKIEGILVGKSDLPPLVEISLVGRFTGVRTFDEQHITLRSKTLFPEVASLIKKFDEAITNDLTLTSDDRAEIAAALNTKLGSEAASKAVMIATYVYYADAELLPTHSPARKGMSQRAARYAADNALDFSAEEAGIVSQAANNGELIPSSILAKAEEAKVIKNLVNSSTLSTNKAIRQAIAEVLSATLTKGRSPATGQFL